MLRYNKFPTEKSGHGYERKIYVHDDKTTLCYFCRNVGHMTSKCRHLPKIGSSNAFITNKKGPKKIWVVMGGLVGTGVALITQFFHVKLHIIL